MAHRLNKIPYVCECGKPEWYDGDCADPKCRKAVHKRRIFSLSLGDWLDPEVPVEWLAEMLDTIRQCDQVNWLLLTKRPELWRHRLADNYPSKAGNKTLLWNWLDIWLNGTPPHNVWIGTTVEDNKRADERIPELLKIPAKVHFLSMEPLLEEIKIFTEVCSGCGKEGCGSCPCGTTTIGPSHKNAKIDWVICGGESGPSARPCNVEWIRSIAHQCKAANVPVFVKQLGSNVHGDPRDGFKCNYPAPEFYRARLKHPKGGDPAEWPEDLRVQEFPNL